MSGETVFIPPDHRAVRRGGVFIPPLLILSWLVYNIVGFLVFGQDPSRWNDVLFTIPMVSGVWQVTAGDILLTVSLGLLFVEIVKSTRTGTSSVLEHMLSTLVFVLFLIEFILLGVAASSVFFLLMMFSLVDLVAGFTVSITGAGRDVSMN